MKLILYYFIILVGNGIIMNHQDDEIINYKNALPSILNSNDFKEYGFGDKNYYISSEIISFSNFDRFFKEELNKNTVDEAIVNEVVRSEKELLKLNARRCSKIKIFFSEQKENIFFAEVFISKRKNIKYEDRPIFGTSNIYMFKINNKKTSLITIKKMHYN